jgi:regulator of cell morphogenesis and NO signaling
MTSCDLHTSAPDWIIEHPDTLVVFRELGIDYCCGGRSLEYACQQQDLNAQVVLFTLHQCLSSKGNESSFKESHDGHSPCESG